MRIEERLDREIREKNESRERVTAGFSFAVFALFRGFRVPNVLASEET